MAPIRQRRSWRKLRFEALEPRHLMTAPPVGDGDPTSENVEIAAVAGAGTRQMEYLNRGVVAVYQGSGNVYVGWRMLGTDASNLAFNLYRSLGTGVAVKLNSQPLTQTTDFRDLGVGNTQSRTYFVRPVINGVEQTPSESFVLAASAPTQQYLSIPLDPPPGGHNPATSETVEHDYTYNANDASVGDVDGDGQYEIILKWDPSDSKDNSQDGYTGNVYVDAYKLDGTRLWRIDLGRNIRAGAHYTQFIVYDLDGDGRAEVACKTAPGTIDGQGNYVLLGNDNANADYRNSEGYVLTGPEYLTIFNGQTGTAMVTIPFEPARGSSSQWGDGYGNRVDRFLAGVAYLDGVRPSLIISRGYYGPQSGGQARNEIVAYNWRNNQLTKLWHFRAGQNINGNTNRNYVGQGNHNLSIADVDGDGRDEVIYGAAVIDDNGTGLYTTRLGHGDALHVGDFDPMRPGLEIFDIHEPVHDAGAELHDAKTGRLIWKRPSTGDEGPGRGVAGDIWAGNPGAEMWAAGAGISGLFDAHGNNVGRTPSSTNFLVWWDADPVRELLDSNHIDKYGTTSDTRLLTASGASSNNGTKSTPALSADILGDWREEVIWRASNNLSLRIYTTTTPATSRMYTLMHDTQYREAIAWQNAAYNQPPHPSFFIGAGMKPAPVPNIYLVKSTSGSGSGSLAAWIEPGIAAANSASNSPLPTIAVASVSDSATKTNSPSIRSMRFSATTAIPDFASAYLVQRVRPAAVDRTHLESRLREHRIDDGGSNAILDSLDRMFAAWAGRGS